MACGNLLRQKQRPIGLLDVIQHRIAEKMPDDEVADTVAQHHHVHIILLGIFDQMILWRFVDRFGFCINAVVTTVFGIIFQ